MKNTHDYLRNHHQYDSEKFNACLKTNQQTAESAVKFCTKAGTVKYCGSCNQNKIKYHGISGTRNNTCGNTAGAERHEFICGWQWCIFSDIPAASKSSPQLVEQLRTGR